MRALLLVDNTWSSGVLKNRQNCTEDSTEKHNTIARSSSQKNNKALNFIPKTRTTKHYSEKRNMAFMTNTNTMARGWRTSLRVKRREPAGGTSDELDAALMQATIDGSLVRVQELMAQGANRYVRHASAMLDNHVSYDRDAFDTPLEAACWLGHTDIVSYFLHRQRSSRRLFRRSSRNLNKEEQNDNILDKEIFLVACQGGTLETVKCFVSRFGPSIVQHEYENVTPLHHACARCHLPLIQYLIAQGARLDAPSPRGGATAVHWLGMYVEMKQMHQGVSPIPLPDDEYLTEESYEAALAWIIRNFARAVFVPDNRGTTGLQRILKRARLGLLQTAVVELLAQCH